MMNKIIAAITALLALFGLSGLKSKRDEKHGETRAELENANDELEAIEEANRIRDRLNHDDEFADRVRDRFTR